MAEEKKKTTARKRRTKKDDSEPLMASYGSASGVTSQRRNLSGVIERTDRWKNIDDGLIPFRSSKGYGKTTLSIRNAVILCQKCYYNFSIFRNIVDTMTEFSTSGIYFRGGNKKSREFFEALFNKISLQEFQDKFFREYYRSGNVFTYRYDAILSEQDVKSVTQVYGKQQLPKLPVEKMSIPSRYIILNPADIQLHGALNFSEGRYHKVLSDYELERVKNPKSDEDLEIYESLDEKTKKLLKKPGSVPTLFIPLNPDKLNAIFYHKQDYEPFAVPMGYPVLEDINFKYEMKKMDMAIARTMQQAILLVTMGDEPEKGGINQENLRKMQALFQNESIGRVLIADYTTKAEFVIPQIGALLDPKKYEVVDRDINIGLNNIFIGGEKFANQSAKVEVFIERLKCGREAFINQFLMPEIKRIARSLGFRSFPTPHFEDIGLKTDSETLRVYTRLIELGVLTAEEGVEAIGTHRLPTKEESVESQEEFKRLRDKGLYEPIAGGPETQKDLADRTHQGQMELQKENNKSQEKMGREKLKQGVQEPVGKPSPPGVKKESGRPSGTKEAPYKSNRKVTPIGGKDGYSITKVKELFALSQDLEIKVAKILRKKHKVKRLTNKQKEVSREISNIVMANEKSTSWLEKAQEYCDKPADKNKQRVDQINEVACLHEIDMEAASILYASKQKLEN